MSNEQEARYNQREVSEALNRRNWLRAFISSIVLTILIPCFLILVHATGMYGVHNSGAKTFLVVVEVFQIVSAVVGYIFISQEETEKLNILFRVYFYATQFMLLIIARTELAYESSSFAFVLTMIYAFLVPVFKNKERFYFMFSNALLATILAASAAYASRTTFEVALFAGLSIIISKYLSNNVLSQEKLIVNLKSKTVSSEKDFLTGLTNRRGIDKKAAVMWPYCAKHRLNLGVIEIDIDYFKKFNDKYGHPAGDKCLKKVAGAIKTAAMQHTDIVARVGGEEFMVFVQGMNEREVIELCMDIRKSVEALDIKQAFVGVSNLLTVSMGVAIATPETMTDFDSLYEQADVALYKAKNNGRNCIVYDNKIYGRMRKGNATAISV